MALEHTEGPLGALQFDVEYRGPGKVAWHGAGAGASCRWIIQADIHACNDKRDDLMTCAVVDTGGFTGPLPLVECELAASDEDLAASDFRVRVTDASTPSLQPIDAEVSVTSVVPIASSTTTTTNPDRPPIEYDVVFALGDEEAPFEFTLLQLELRHEGAVGAWLGTGNDVDCRWLLSADNQVCNKISNRVASCLATAVSTLSATGPILECGFSSSDDVVEPSDFSAFVSEVSTPFGTPDRVRVLVDSVTPR